MATVLYGECIGAGDTSAVRICSLADMGCDLELDGAETMAGGEIALWIGAIGPFHGTARATEASRLAVRFKEPLDGRIIQHFRG